MVNFADRATEDIFNGENTAAARGTRKIWGVAWRKLDQLDSATELRDLALPPGNRREALTRDREGQHSIRINDQYRVCFIWTVSGPVDVEITDYH